MRLPMTVMFAVLAAGAAAGEPGASKKHSAEPPKVLVWDLEFPGKTDREALVFLQFDLPTNGRATNIRLVDDGFHEKRFVDAATYALQKAKFQPRRIDGKAVDCWGLILPVKFSVVGGEPGVTDEFRTEILKVEELLQQGDYAGGEFHAQWMLTEKVKLGYEYALLQAELARTYAVLGRNADALRKATKATERPEFRTEYLQLLDSPPPNKPSNYLLNKDLIVQLLDMRMRLLAAQGLALEALQPYYELAGLVKLNPDDLPVRLANALTAQIRGPGNLRGKIQLNDTKYRRQYLSRRRFAVEKVDGRIDTLSVMCSAGAKQLAYAPGEEWTVPADWGLCTVDVTGEPGTSFEFVEFPDAP